MGGLGPGIGGLEYLVIGIVALLVVGPERLPGMLRQMGKWVAKARGMANEFRSSFDEMARQSELDELRKEVQALRDGQGSVGQGMVKLGAEADAAFKEIKTELEQPALPAPQAAVTLDKPEFPEPVMTPLNDVPAKPKKTRATKAAANPVTAGSASKPKTTSAKPKVTAAKPRTAAAKTAATPARPRPPRNTKLDL